MDRPLPNQGVIFVELLIAFAVWAIFLVGLTSVLFELSSSNNILSNYIGQENELNEVLSWNGSATQAQQSSTQTSTIAYLDRGIAGVNEQSSASYISIDWQDAFSQPSCRALDTDSFSLLNISDPITLDGSNTATGLIVRGNYAYVSTNSSSTTDPDLYIVDIGNPLNLKVVSKIDTGPGIVGMNLSGYTLYAANTSINAHVQAIDVEDIHNPYVTWSFKVPGTHGTTTAYAQTVTSDSNGHVYLGTEKSTLPELYVIDKNTHQSIASYQIGSGINSLYYDNGLLYAAVPIAPGLEAFSSSTNLVPTFLYNSNNNTGSNAIHGKKLESINQTFYLGKTVGGNELVQLSKPTLSEIKESKVGFSIDAMISTPDYIYAVTSDPTGQFQVWKNSDLSLVQKIVLPARAVGIGCSDKYIVIAIGNNQPLVFLKSI